MATKLVKFLYPLPTPDHRPRKQPMRVLCLGLPRSGTDSLRTALLTLGLKRIWHGFDLPLYRPNDCALWAPLVHAKVGSTDPQKTENLDPATFDWDRLLGDCDGLMDMPPCHFWAELMQFYPDAKVIINRRRDMDAWHRSLDKAASFVFGSWILWVLTFFDAPLFWEISMTKVCFEGMSDKGQTFKTGGKAWAERYYAEVEKTLQAQGREYLVWEVEQGWEPLCKFLGEPVPEVEFPWGNKSGQQFEKNANMAMGKMIGRAFMRLGLLVAVVVGGAAWLMRT